MDEELFKQFLQQYFQQNPDSYFGSQSTTGIPDWYRRAEKPNPMLSSGGTSGLGKAISSMGTTAISSGFNPYLMIAQGGLSALSSLLGGESTAEKQAKWSLEQKKKLMGKFSGEYNNPRDMISNNKMLEVFGNHQTAMEPTYSSWASNLSRSGGLRTPEAMNVLGRNKTTEQSGFMENLSMENLREMFQNMLSLRGAMAQVAG